MHIQNIETADCIVLSSEVFTNKVRIHFESVYNFEKKQYVNNVDLVIMNWSAFEAKVYISDGSDGIGEEKKLSENDLELFEYIQVISNEGNELILQGYSINSGGWLKYHFVDSFIYLKQVC